MKSRVSRPNALFASIFLAGAILPASSMAAPIVRAFSSNLEQEASFTVSGNTGFRVPALAPATGKAIGVPGFDSALGPLLSARLTIESYLASALLDHAESALLLRVEIGHELEVTTGSWTPKEALSAIIASSNDPDFDVNTRNYYSPSSDSDVFIPLIKPIPSVEVERRRTSSVTFDEYFTGSDLSLFVDADQIGFGSTRLYQLSFEGYHERGFLGGLTTQFLGLPTESQPGTKPRIGSALLTALRLLNLLVEDDAGHGLSYSHMHVGASAQLGMTVEYTYESARAVPEPGALALYAVGLGGFGLLGYGRSRRGKP